jgi:hypothetical protein
MEQMWGALSDQLAQFGSDLPRPAEDLGRPVEQHLPTPSSQVGEPGDVTAHACEFRVLAALILQCDLRLPTGEIRLGEPFTGFVNNGFVDFEEVQTRLPDRDAQM